MKGEAPRSRSSLPLFPPFGRRSFFSLPLSSLKFSLPRSLLYSFSRPHPLLSFSPYPFPPSPLSSPSLFLLPLSVPPLFFSVTPPLSSFLYPSTFSHSLFFLLLAPRFPSHSLASLCSTCFPSSSTFLSHPSPLSFLLALSRFYYLFSLCPPPSFPLPFALTILSLLLTVPFSHYSPFFYRCPSMSLQFLLLPSLPQSLPIPLSSFLFFPYLLFLSLLLPPLLFSSLSFLPITPFSSLLHFPPFLPYS